VTVLRPEFATSGLTRAALRGGEVVTATGLAATLAAAREVAAGTDRPTVVYAHHGDLDALGHLTGAGSDRWCEELAAIETAIAAGAEDLPRDVALVVTADHGMVTIPPDGFVELADLPELLDGVRVLTGDPRARQLHAVPGAADDLLAAWREHVAVISPTCVSRDEAIAAGWFGPEVAEHVRPRIGDVVLSAAVLDVAWVHRDADLFGGRLPGQHGALTPEELRGPGAGGRDDRVTRPSTSRTPDPERARWPTTPIRSRRACSLRSRRPASRSTPSRSTRRSPTPPRSASTTATRSDRSGNCIVVASKDDPPVLVACLALATTKLDVNRWSAGGSACARRRSRRRR
jgi:hypothetical protein